MPRNPLSAGDYIAAKCSKCRSATNHTIVAMVQEKVVRVECNICGGIHNYRPATQTRPVTPRSVKEPGKPKTTRSEKQWQSLLEDVDSAAAVPYSMQTPVRDGDLIKHPSFGLGKVISVTKPNKMEVCFQDGVKILRCTVV